MGSNPTGTLARELSRVRERRSIKEQTLRPAVQERVCDGDRAGTLFASTNASATATSVVESARGDSACYGRYELNGK